MKLGKLIDLQALVSRLNDENNEHGIVYRVSDVHQYCKGGYSLSLQFDLMFSPDVADLMRWCFDSDVSVRITHSDDGCYMDFQ